MPQDAAIQDVFRYLANDTIRTALIADEIKNAYQQGRKVLLLTERTEHLDAILHALNDQLPSTFMLHGRLTKKRSAKLITELEALPPDVPRVLLATGKLTGEGFDYPPLDTLMLAMPISWKGSLRQYAGRLHREHATKTDVRIIDCVDTGHPGAATHVGQTPARLSCHGLPDSGAIGVERAISSGIMRYRQQRRLNHVEDS